MDRPFQYIDYILKYMQEPEPEENLKVFHLPDGRKLKYNFAKVEEQFYSYSKAI